MKKAVSKIGLSLIILIIVILLIILFFIIYRPLKTNNNNEYSYNLYICNTSIYDILNVSDTNKCSKANNFSEENPLIIHSDNMAKEIADSLVISFNPCDKCKIPDYFMLNTDIKSADDIYPDLKPWSTGNNYSISAYIYTTDTEHLFIYPEERHTPHIRNIVQGKQSTNILLSKYLEKGTLNYVINVDNSLGYMKINKIELIYNNTK